MREERGITLARLLQSARAMVQPGTRGQLERAVHTMRIAERTDDVVERVRLGRQALLELYELQAIAETGARCKEAKRAVPVPVDASLAHAEKLEFEALAQLFASLERRIDLRTSREIAASTWLGYTALVASCVSLIWFFAKPTNLALGKHVTASSICNFTPAPPLGKDALYRVVDGQERETTFAMCTETQRDPWLTVDLGRVHHVDEVVVYPRTDCCYGEVELPISVELALDNEHFAQVGQDDAPATVDFPWHFSFAERAARYVRIASHSRQFRHIVVGEVEVYGR